MKYLFYTIIYLYIIKKILIVTFLTNPIKYLLTRCFKFQVCLWGPNIFSGGVWMSIYGIQQSNFIISRSKGKITHLANHHHHHHHHQKKSPSWKTLTFTRHFLERKTIRPNLEVFQRYVGKIPWTLYIQMQSTGSFNVPLVLFG